MSASTAENRVAVATQRQLIWWRFKKHKLALISGIIVATKITVTMQSPAYTQNVFEIPSCSTIVKKNCETRKFPIQFDSVEQAMAAHDSPAYQEALAVLGNSCERDMRIVEGLD